MKPQRMNDWAKRVLAPAGRLATRECARVLMYHRFGPGGADRRLSVHELDEQLRYLCRHFHVVPLRDVVSRLKAGRKPEPRSVAITVDDAYADFGEHGYPVFRRHGVPLTLYVVSEFAHGRMWLWWDAIRHLVTQAPEDRYRVTRPQTVVVPLLDASSREDAWHKLADLGLILSPQERETYLHGLQQFFSVSLPGYPTPEFAALDWDALRALDRGLVEVGAHTRTHPILSRCDSGRIHEEIAGSKREIEKELGRDVRAFCYSNGTWSDVDERCLSAVGDAGYDSAVMACGTLVCKGANVYALDRMGPSEKWDTFVSDVSGLAHLRRRLGGARSARS